NDRTEQGIDQVDVIAVDHCFLRQSAAGPSDCFCCSGTGQTALRQGKAVAGGETERDLYAGGRPEYRAARRSLSNDTGNRRRVPPGGRATRIDRGIEAQLSGA